MIARATLDESDGAMFSNDERYRYRLWRKWGPGDRWCLFVMLNPSTASETELDPTVRGCMNRARRWGYDGLEVCNLFGLRSTDPRALYTAEDPVGADNNWVIRETALRCDLVIAAWGNHGALKNRHSIVLGMLRVSGVEPKCLRVNRATAFPAHPLYVPLATEPIDL